MGARKGFFIELLVVLLLVAACFYPVSTDVRKLDVVNGLIVRTQTWFGRETSREVTDTKFSRALAADELPAKPPHWVLLSKSNGLVFGFVPHTLHYYELWRVGDYSQLDELLPRLAADERTSVVSEMRRLAVTDSREERKVNEFLTNIEARLTSESLITSSVFMIKKFPGGRLAAGDCFVILVFCFVLFVG